MKIASGRSTSGNACKRHLLQSPLKESRLYVP